MTDELRYGDKVVEVTEADKVFFPEADLTKGDTVDYYREIAQTMLPYMQDRPLTLQRYPDGIAGEGFIQQKRSDYFPDWVAPVKTPLANDRRKSIVHAMCNDEASLVYLANQAVITFHGWLSRAPEIEQPDKLIFDIDPANDDFTRVRKTARLVRDFMERLGMTPYVMTTGSRGLHVVSPIKPVMKFDAVREYAKAMAQALAARHPKELTTEQRKDKRGNRIYLDVMRNAYGQTAVLPYTVRDKAIAPVATPLSWDELDNAELHSQSYHIRNILRRLGQREDPWQGMARHAVTLAKLCKPEEIEPD
jgi:bifunctional non-homologous end joining protein LigD